MKSVIRLLFTILCLLCISGCWDNKNLQDLLYATAIGIDYKDNQYEAYIQIVNFNNVAKAETGGGSNGPQVYIGKGKGKTVSMALGNIYDTMQRRLFWSHVRAFLFTESAIRAGGDEYFDNLKRYREFRYTPWIFGTKGSIEDVFKTPAFFQFSPISTILGTPEENYVQKSFVKPIQAQEYQIYLNEPGDTAIVPTLAIDSTSWQTEKKRDSKLKINGVFVVRKNDFQGWMGHDQISGLRWMNKETSRSAVETRSAIISLEKPRPKISISKQDGKTVFNITVKLRGNIVELMDGRSSEEEMEEEAEAQVKKEIRSTYEQGVRIQADMYNFRNVLFKKRYSNWKDIRLTPSSLNRIDVHVNIQHTGELKKG